MFPPIYYLKTLKPQFINPSNISSPISHLYTYISTRLMGTNPAIEFLLNESEQRQFSKTQFNSPAQNEEKWKNEEVSCSPKVQISHPWSEWVDLMEILLKNGYFDGTGNPFADNNGELGKKEANFIRTACLNFARDQYQLIRHLSRKDIVVIAESGCPSTDRKVVNSGKRIRAHVGVNEGNVCSSCVLRGDCDRAYVMARADEGGRTVDVMRLLLPYCLDPIVGSVESRPYLNRKVKESVRILVKEIVAYRVEGHDHELPKVTSSECSPPTHEDDIDKERSMKQGDWICPECKFNNFARNIKCLRCGGLFQGRLKKLAAEQDQLPLKKGDWICDKCNFLNFARNTRCLQCKEKAPKRQINPGEWECESCNYINFRRNMVCLKCDHRRPITSNTAAASQFISNSATAMNHQARPWLELQQQNSREGNYPLEFIQNEYPDPSGRSSLNPRSNFMDFPIVGGNSELSQDVQKQELWKTEMANLGGIACLAREDTSIHKSSKFYPYDASGDVDEMAEWFRGG